MTSTANSELILEPDLPIIDPHHHLWDATPLVPDSVTYLLREFLADVDTGHRVESTVYVEAVSMYRADVPYQPRPVGEVEFANGVAAMSASGRYGHARVCAGIVGDAELIGDRVTDVRPSTRGGRQWPASRCPQYERPDADRSIYPAPRPAGLLRDVSFRAGFARLASFGLSFDAWLHHTHSSTR